MTGSGPVRRPALPPTKSAIPRLAATPRPNRTSTSQELLSYCDASGAGAFGEASPAPALPSVAMGLSTAPAVALGGMAGAALRWWLTDVWPGGATAWATLALNVAGSALLGWLVASRSSRDAVAKAVGAGFCGSFTTFSAFGLIVAEHVDSGRVGSGLMYAAVSFAAAISAALAAGWLRRRFPRALRRVSG